MRIIIPIVVGSKGTVNGYVAVDADGKTHHDIGMAYDCIPEDEIPVQVNVSIDLDMVTLFKAHNVEGVV
jgi:hypothetical protein